MASKVIFFNPDSVIGELADWEIQEGSNPNVTRQRAQELKANGDELQSVQYGAQVAYSMNYKGKKVTGDALVIPAPGSIKNGKHVDSVEVSYTQTDFPALAVAAHAHAALDGMPEAHDECRVYTPDVVLPPRAIGVPSTLKDTDGETVFTCPEGVGMRSLTYSLAINHIDEPDGEGGHLAGQNHDGTETLTLDFTGEIDIADLGIGESWKLPDSEGKTRTNAGAHTTSVTLTRHISFDEEATPEGAEN
jgi:hypothetical protein